MKITERITYKKCGLEITIDEARKVFINEFGEILKVGEETIFIGSAYMITPDSAPYSTQLCWETGNSIEEVFNKIMEKINV